MHIPKSGSFEPAPEGQHVACCIRILDLGTQEGEYMGDKTLRHQIMIEWELPHAKMKDGRPFTFGAFYTLSSSEKSRLRQHLEAWRGRKFKDGDFGPGGFQIQKLLGQWCMISVGHEERNGQIKAKMLSIAGLPAGTPKPKMVNPPAYLSLNPEEFDEEIYNSLSDGLKKKIASSPEWEELRGSGGGAGKSSSKAQGNFVDDEIPF